MSRSVNSPAPRRRWRLWKIMLWLVLAVLLGVAGAGTYVWFHPVRAEWVHERVLARLRKAAGVDVAYDSAVLDLPRGLYTFTNLRFGDGSPGGELLRLGTLDVRLRPTVLLMGGERFIKEIDIAQPSVLDIYYDSTGVHLGPKLAFLARTTRKSQSAEGATESGRARDLPLEQFRIRDAKIQFEEVTSGTEPGTTVTRPTAVLVGEIAARSVGKGDISAAFEGTGFAAPADGSAVTGRPIASGIKTNALFRREKEHDVLELTGSIGSASLGGLFANLPGSSGSGTDVQLELKARRHKDGTDIHLALDAASLDVTSAEHGVDIHDENVQALFKSRFDLKNAALTLDDVEASSSLVALATSGTISTRAPHEYAMNLHATRLAGGYRKLLTNFLPQGWTVTAPDDAVELDAQAAGDRQSLASLIGQLRFTGVKVVTSRLQQTLSELTGAIDLQPSMLVIDNLSAKYGKTDLAVRGEIAGDFLRKREGQMRLNWMASTTGDGLISLLEAREKLSSAAKQPAKSAAVAKTAKSQGSITGSGTYQQFVSLAAPEKTLPPQVDGTVLVKNTSFSHPSLPAPLDGMNGSLHIDGDRLQVDSLSGNLRSTSVKVTGAVKGRNVFWQDPVLSAAVTTQLDLAQIVTYLPVEQKQIVMKNRISGEAVTNFTLSGSIKQLADAKFVGNVQLRNVSFYPALEFMEGGFAGLNGEVTWDGHSVTVKELRGRLNGELLHATGFLSPDAMALDMDGVTDLGSVTKTFPKLSKWLEMGGPARYDLKFAVGDPAALQAAEPAPLPLTDDGVDTSGNRLVTLLAQISKRLEDAVAARQFKLTGDVEFQGSTIRHRAMPMERVEGGRTIPRGEVRGMRGIAKLENDIFRIPEDAPVQCQFSDTKSCRLSGTLQMRHEDLPKMDMRIETSDLLRLDSWITGWGMELPKTPTPLVTGKKFELDAVIAAPRIIYKGQTAGRSRGVLNYKLTQDESPRVTTFKQIDIAGDRQGLGSLRGSGSIESYVWDPSRYPHWTAQVTVDRMPLESILTAVFKEPTTLSGIVVGGQTQLQGIGSDGTTIQGDGSARIANLVVGGNPVFQQIGQQTRQTFGGRYFQTADAANFRVGNGALSSTDLQLQSNGMRVDIRGDYYFAGNRQRGIPERTLDGLMRVNFFKSVFGNIPIIGELAGVADEIAGAFVLAFRVSGNADHPMITPILAPMFTGGLGQQ